MYNFGMPTNGRFQNIAHWCPLFPFFSPSSLYILTLVPLPFHAYHMLHASQDHKEPDKPPQAPSHMYQKRRINPLYEVKKSRKWQIKLILYQSPIKLKIKYRLHTSTIPQMGLFEAQNRKHNKSCNPLNSITSQTSTGHKINPHLADLPSFSI